MTTLLPRPPLPSPALLPGLRPAHTSSRATLSSLVPKLCQTEQASTREAAHQRADRKPLPDGTAKREHNDLNAYHWGCIRIASSLLR